MNSTLAIILVFNTDNRLILAMTVDVTELSLTMGISFPYSRAGQHSASPGSSNLPSKLRDTNAPSELNT